MAMTDLRLEPKGTLVRPGPIGRLVRLLFGILCLWYVAGLIQVGSDLLTQSGEIHGVVWNGILPGLLLVSYVINIGFSRNWKKRPALISAALLGAIACVGYLAGGTVDTAALARALWFWELYVFGHLGVSFVVASAIGTPGCEMRAFHDLYSRITGVESKEHECPIGPLRPIDQWEARQRD